MVAPAELEFDEGTLLLGPPGLEPERVSQGFVRDPRAGGRYRARGVSYREALLHLRTGGLTDAARAYEALELKHRGTRKPYPHQAEALDAWWGAGGRGVVVLPTGAGKSHVAELIMQRVQRATLVVVPTVDLLVQWQRGLSLAFGEPVGMLGGGSNDVRPITITTYDSAYLHMHRIGNRFGLVVFDEVHHLPASAYSQAAEMCIAPFRLGLTATPERTDGLHLRLDTLVGPEVYRRQITELTGEYLAEYDTCVLPVPLTAEERVRYDEADRVYRAFIARNRIRLGAPDGWQRFLQLASRSAEGRAAHLAWRERRRVSQASEGKLQVLGELFAAHAESKVVVFTNDNRTIYEISRRFLIPVITHETPARERLAILSGIESGRYRIVGTSRVLNEGVDMPDVAVAIVVSGTGSVREAVQRLGRILRRREGKQAVLYELVADGTSEDHTSDRRRNHEAFAT